ncbi:Putative heavy-metal chelation [Dethiosulfatibacter aminovorans DSM 17477]|uniref:Putative heavy-metal chelation n=1 Tax=Dethiosulfatibacter aminovorans DSM 17477 TaxID=1121476 RepID=A0A1M6ABU8_9FIRM|nr:DUF364 domain-containing protein [Dethiosulfatibacter aminovorans]SHI33994.1 Putative heavy-metal chelation [Dethiosulfatibacter aminovorans DSM 17477]
MEFYSNLNKKFKELVKSNNLENESIIIETRALKPEEAIGHTSRKDYPILTGKEVLMNAYFKECIGQSFTNAPSKFKGTLKDVASLDLSFNKNRAIFISVLNATMKYLGLIDRTIHCKNEEPEICSGKYLDYLKEKYGDVKIGLVGYQPSMLEKLSESFELRILDLDKNNIGTNKYGIVVEDGEKAFSSVVDWADIILVTGSTVANGTVVDFINLDKEVIFYGTTIAGVAHLEKLNRCCFCAN